MFSYGKDDFLFFFVCKNYGYAICNKRININNMLHCYIIYSHKICRLFRHKNDVKTFNIYFIMNFCFNMIL